SRTHPETLPADTRYPIPIRITVPRRPVPIRIPRTPAIPFPSGFRTPPTVPLRCAVGGSFAVTLRLMASGGR
ncbi:hypothetical protein, partial [uncultured Bacteroides sp.]|uniref:hypothetical protein n=1 Tax=uncultured Bacteroides sp. TaxID=162156 RepID=UPI00259CA291